MGGRLFKKYVDYLFMHRAREIELVNSNGKRFPPPTYKAQAFPDAPEVMTELDQW